jgi:hypothetical protein
MIHISSNFDGGNITWAGRDEDGAVQLKIDRDEKADFRQWFHLYLNGLHRLDMVSSDQKLNHKLDASHVKSHSPLFFRAAATEATLLGRD